jgi:hypothetical protein
MSYLKKDYRVLSKTELRLLTDDEVLNSKAFYTNDNNQYSTWIYDISDVSSADDDVNIIVNSQNKRFKKTNLFTTYVNFVNQTTSPTNNNSLFFNNGKFNTKNGNGFLQIFDTSSYTGDKIITFPNTSGTVGLLQSSQTWSAINNFPFIGLTAQTNTSITPTTGLILYANSINALSWKGANSYVRTFDGTANTADRTYTLPDSSGTLGLLESSQNWNGINRFNGTTTSVHATQQTNINSPKDDSIFAVNGYGVSFYVTHDVNISTPIEENGFNISAYDTRTIRPIVFDGHLSEILSSTKNLIHKGYVDSNFLNILGNNLTESINYKSISIKPITPITGFKLYANSTNALSWIGANGYIRTFDGTANTADRTYILPNSSGTFGLLESSQTWSGTNNFSGTVTGILNSTLVSLSTISSSSPSFIKFNGGVATVDINTYINTNQLGMNSGVATLNSSGKLNSNQIPDSLVGAVVYQGVWNASTNTPTLTTGVGTKGFYYKVNVAGTTNVDGHSSWIIGDTIIFNGTTWDKLDGAEMEVTSVFGRTGIISLLSTDVTGALGYTPYNSSNPNNYTNQTALNLKFDKVGGSISGNTSIGTSTLNTTFQVNKDTQTIGSTLPSGAFVVSNENNGGFGLEIGANVSILGSWIQSRNSTRLNYYNLLLQPSGGNVGIGTTTPHELLEIGTSTGGRLLLSDAGDTNRIGLLIQSPTSTSPYATFLSYDYGLNTYKDIVFQGSGGNIGIGTFSPAYKLDVNGTFRVIGSTILPTSTNIGSVTSNEISYLSGVTSAIQPQFTGKASIVSNNFTGINTFNANISINGVSFGKGNISNTSSTVSATNIAIGGLSTISTGINNTVIGIGSGYDIKSGTNNTFIGYNTALLIDTGSYNTIIGANVTGLDKAINNIIILADGQGNRRLNIFSDGNTMLGTDTYYNDTRFGVFGGLYGANISARGTTNSSPMIQGYTVTDQSTIQLQGADFDTQGKSTYLQYLGSSNTTSNILNLSTSNLARLVMDGDNNVIYSSFANPIIFGNSAVEKFRLASNGYLGVGTTIPDTKIHLHNIDTTPSFLTVSNSLSKALFGVSSTGETLIGSYGQNILKFGYNLGTTLVETMRINSAGNIGIGTTAPVYKLDVGGTFRVTGGTTLPTATTIGSVTSTEIGYLSGVNSSIQTQLTGKASTVSNDFTGINNFPLLGLTAQPNVNIFTPTTGLILFANSSNALSWKGANGYFRTFDGTANTADRTYTLPNASGTIPLLQSTQTWSGVNAFTSALNVATNITSTNGDMILSDNAGTIFRGIRANSWVDAISTRFFQVGSVGDNVMFTTSSSNNFNRLGFISNVTQFSTNGYLSALSPLGIFEVSGSSTRFFNIYSTGNIGIGTNADTGYKLDINGTVRIVGATTLPIATNIGSVTSTQIGYLSGVTSAIQIQINSKANLSDLLLKANLSGVNSFDSINSFAGVSLTSQNPINIPTPTSGFTLFGNLTNAFSWKGANGYFRTFDGTTNTADRTYTLPNASGTFGLLEGSQIWTGNNNWAGINNYSGNLNSNNFTANNSSVDVGNFQTLIASNGFSYNHTSVGAGKFLITDQYGNANWSFVSFPSLTSKPTTLSGYGITDSYPLTGNPSNFIALTSLSAGTGISYNNITGVITNTSPSSGGTVTNVSALTLTTTGTDLTSTVATSTTTPVITLNVPNSSATNRGVLSSVDWNTFNGKQSTITNPVTGTGTVNYLSKFTGTGAIGNSLVFDNGTNIGIGTTTPDTKIHLHNIDTTPNFLTVSNSLSKALFGVSSTGEVLIGSYGQNILKFGYNLGTTLVETMRINSAGNIGIGTTTPAYKLDVGGTFRVTGGTILPTATTIGSVTSTEIGYLSGVNSSIQPQLNGKANTVSNDFTGINNFPLLGLTAQPNVNIFTPTTGLILFANSSNAFSWKGANGYFRTFDGTANTADRTYTLPNASGTFGLLESSQIWSGINTFTGNTTLPTTTTIGAVTSTQIGYLSGVTSAIQTQINTKQNTLTNPITGTGTVNYLSKFTGTGTIGSSLVFDNGTNIGIGTTTPTQKLEINGTLFTNKPRTSTGSILPIAIGSQRFDGTGTGISGMYHIEAGSGGFGQASHLAFYTSTDDIAPTEKLRITNTGQVGIGTTTPAFKLDVTGNVNATAYATNGYTTQIDNGGTGNIYSYTRVIGNTGLGVNDGLFIGYGNATSAMNRIFDGGTSNYLGVGSGTVSTTGITKFLFGTQTDDGTFAQFSGAVKAKSDLTVGGNSYLGTTTFSSYIQMNNNNFMYFKDNLGNGRRHLGIVPNGTFYMGDVDNVISGSQNLYLTNTNHIWYTNGTQKAVLLQNGNFGIGTATPTSTLHNTGSEASSIIAISVATTLADNYYVVANGASTYLITLPTASTVVGRTYAIKVLTAGKTISSFLNTTGTATTILAIGIYYITSDGTNWQQF